MILRAGGHDWTIEDGLVAGNDAAQGAAERRRPHNVAVISEAPQRRHGLVLTHRAGCTHSCINLGLARALLILTKGGASRQKPFRCYPPAPLILLLCLLFSERGGGNQTEQRLHCTAFTVITLVLQLTQATYPTLDRCPLSGGGATSPLVAGRLESSMGRHQFPQVHLIESHLAPQPLGRARPGARETRI